MHNLLTRLHVISFALSVFCFTQVQDDKQLLLSNEGLWEVNTDKPGSEILQPIHRIPSDRGKDFDPWNLSSFTNTTFHNEYRPLYEINEYLEHLAALYPENVTISELGHTGEGREMYAIKVTGGSVFDEDGQRRAKKGFVIFGAQHAREWIASASALYLAHALVTNPSEPNSLSHLLEEFNFYIIPVPNPDGYVFTWEHDRLWYKNRMPLGPDQTCQGLDMNRNWGFQWSSSVLDAEEELDIDESDDPESLKKKKGKKGRKGKKPKKPKTRPVPADPCSQWYPGHRPYEAPEVNNIANYIMQLPNLHVFLDLRSYGQMLSWPYSYACDVLPADAEDLYEAALGAAFAVRKKHGTVYTTGSLCSMLYPAPGNILDWMYAEAGIKYSYAVHLRDKGTYGYMLPQEWIRPVGEETATVVEYITSFILNPRK